MASFFGTPRSLTKRGGAVAGSQEGELVAPKYTAPKYDQDRIAGLIQEQQAPALAEARRRLSSARGRRYGSLTERAEALRAESRGTGESMAAIGASAARTARGLYQSEYDRQREESMTRYGMDVSEYKRRLAEQERQREEQAIAEERGIRMGTPTGGGETYRSAYDRMNAYDPFGASARFDTRPMGLTETTSYGPSAAQRSAIEEQGMQELQDLYSSSSGGYDPSRGYGG